MILLELFRKNRICKHTKVSADTDYAYCPDCGELVENQWYLNRCSCCGVKVKSMMKNGEIVPVEKFCSNCGNIRWVTEKLEKINFIDINFAVMVKAVIQNKGKDITQSWVDPHAQANPKLIAQNK